MVRETGQPRRLPDALTDEDVSAYLREHPDFLAEHPELLPRLTPPALDHGRGVVDFQVFLAGRLRERLSRLEANQRELIGTTRANLDSQARIHAAILLLLDARSFDQLIQSITNGLAGLLDLDVASLIVESNGGERPHVHTSGVRVVDAGTIDTLMGPQPVRLAGDIAGNPAIHGASAGLVRSEALIRLRISRETPAGMLAFGSREPDTFHPGQGTELIGFLARVVERLIRSWLDLSW
jgi:uncharacterized protein